MLPGVYKLQFESNQNTFCWTVKCPKCTTPIMKSTRYVLELNKIQNKYEKVKNEYATIKGKVDIKQLKAELLGRARPVR